MASLQDRFTGQENRTRLVAALRQNRTVYDDSLADELADIARIEVIKAGDTLIRQNDTSDDLFFILAGRVSIDVKGREVAVRAAGQHVGEMSVADPAARRSATVTALEETAVAIIREPDFTRLGDKYPRCWRLIAKDLADRLRQRDRFVTKPNPRPVVFVGSSTESATVAETIGRLLSVNDFVIRVWTDRGIFGASKFPIEDLEEQVGVSDFAVIVITPDDTTISRGVEHQSPRDNAVFELGIFMGSLSRKRTFLAVPEGADIKIPSDLLGLTQLRYAPPKTTSDLEPTLSSLCEELRKIIVRLGPK